MERKINCLSICYTLFLILLFLSGGISGFLSRIVYFLSFIVPFIVGIFLGGEGGEKKNLLLINKENTKACLPLIFPTVSAIMLVSFVTSFVINGLTGVENNVDVGSSLIPALISHALIPAVLEEMLFRYLPLRLLGSHSGRATVLLSAVFFALIHHNLFSIPYAFLAGVVFMAMDIALDSVIPSIILHFVNNAISVSLLVYQDNFAFAPIVFILIGVLSALSLIFIFINREKYREKLSYAFKNGEKISLTPPAVALGAACLTIAIVSVF